MAKYRFSFVQGQLEGIQRISGYLHQLTIGDKSIPFYSDQPTIIPDHFRGRNVRLQTEERKRLFGGNLVQILFAGDEQITSQKSLSHAQALDPRAYQALFA
jgi:hypothetical protein